MLQRQLLLSCILAVMIITVQAGSKSGKNGKRGSSGGRLGSGGRWNSRPSQWKSPHSWSSSSKDKDDDDKYDDDYEDDDYSSRSNDRRPVCSLANPVQEQFDLIFNTWRLAYLPANANANQLSTYERTVTWHANLVMEKFMAAVELFDDDVIDRDEIFDLGEIEGSAHPGSVNFNNERRQDAVCSQTRALVLMMRETCLFSRWKRTLEISAFYFMNGFIEGDDIDLKLKDCIDFDDKDDDKKRKNRDQDDDDDVDDDDDRRRKKRKKNQKLL